MTLRGVTGVTARRSATSRLPRLCPGVLVIGASTGGPQALVALVAGLAPHLARLPICVTLHMPRDLMPVIAAHVARRCEIETRVVTSPCDLVMGAVHFAPGDRHLVIGRNATGFELNLAASPSRDFCQPAVDVMFASAAKVFGPRTLAVVLSGMGKDGLAGSRAIAAAGGAILVQDDETSAVWGMPGSISKAGLAEAVLPPEAIAREVVRRLRQAQAPR